MSSNSFNILSTADTNETTLDRLTASNPQHVYLANLPRPHTSGYICRGWEKEPMTDKEAEDWIEVLERLIDLQKDNPDACLETLDIHSTGQRQLNQVADCYPDAFERMRGNVKVKNLTLSGFADERMDEWQDVLEVTESITLRGCKHLFALRPWLALTRLTSPPPKLVFVGGNDMDADHIRNTLFAIAVMQRLRHHSNLETFKELHWYFPLTAEEVGRTLETWRLFPRACKFGALLYIYTNTSSSGPHFCGTEEEDERFRTMSPQPKPGTTSLYRMEEDEEAPYKTAFPCGCVLGDVVRAYPEHLWWDYIWRHTDKKDYKYDRALHWQLRTILNDVFGYSDYYMGLLDHFKEDERIFKPREVSNTGFWVDRPRAGDEERDSEDGEEQGQDEGNIDYDNEDDEEEEEGEEEDE